MSEILGAAQFDLQAGSPARPVSMAGCVGRISLDATGYPRWQLIKMLELLLLLARLRSDCLVKAHTL